MNQSLIKLSQNIARKFHPTYRDDIEQELFIESCECEKNFDTTYGTTIEQYCYQRLYFAALHWVEKERKQIPADDLETAPKTPSMDSLAKIDDELHVKMVLEQLDPKENLMFRLRYRFKLTYEEIIEMFGKILKIKSRKTLSKHYKQLETKILFAL